MLTAYQIETVGYVTDGAIICRDCAERRYSEVALSRADQGFDPYPDIAPLSRYEADEHASELAYEYAAEDGRELDYDDIPPVTCEDCMQELS